MKKLLPLTICCVFLWACAPMVPNTSMISERRYHEISIDAQSYSVNNLGMKYIFAPLYHEEISRDDLQFLEYARHAEQLLAGKGLIHVDDMSADMVVTIGYDRSSIGTESLVFQLVGIEIDKKKSGKNRITADKLLWNILAARLGGNGSLQTVFPALLKAMRDYVTLNSPGKIMVTVEVDNQITPGSYSYFPSYDNFYYDDYSTYRQARWDRYYYEREQMLQRERLTEQHERLQLERERLAWEKQETERLRREKELRAHWERDKARYEQERRTQERHAQERQDQQRKEQEKLVQQQRDKEGRAQLQREQERRAQQQRDEERDKARHERERRTQERHARERQDQQRKEQEKLVQQQRDKEGRAQLQRERERRAQQQRDEEHDKARHEQERRVQERQDQQRKEQEKLVQQQRDKERRAQQQRDEERRVQQQREQGRRAQQARKSAIPRSAE